MNEMKFGC